MLTYRLEIDTTDNELRRWVKHIIREWNQRKPAAAPKVKLVLPPDNDDLWQWREYRESIAFTPFVEVQR